MEIKIEMKEECLICKAPLEYLKEDVEMECAVCHKKENSKTYHNAGGEVDLNQALPEIYRRGKEVPGGACGLCNLMTSRALGAIGSNGGPRCCKRDSYLAIMEAVKFTEEKIGVKMELGDIKCTRSEQNNQCLHKVCPFHGGK